MKRLRFWHFPAALAALASLWASACGSRSNLYGPADLGAGGDTGGTGGTGGATTTTSVTTTTTSDTTTTSVTTTTITTTTTTTLPKGPCTTITYQQPFAGLPGGSKENQLFPALMYASQDLQTVTIASGWQVAEGPQVAPIDLRHTSFAPWGMFPAGAGLAPSYLADLDGGASFAIAQAAGEHFALLYAQPPDPGLHFSDAFKPISGDIPSTLVVDGQAQAALFLTRTGKGHTFGGAFEQNGQTEVRAGVVQNGKVLADVAIGCTKGPAIADAAPLGNAAVMAFTNGTPVGNNDGCQNGPPKPSSHADLALFDGASISYSPLTPGAVTDLRLAPRSDGAWAVWALPAQPGGSPNIVAQRLDMKGLPTGETITFTAPLVPGSVGVASFQDFLMIGWIEDVGPDGAAPHVQVIDPGGILRGALGIAPGGTATGRVALLGSPSSHSAALAWTESVAGAGLGAQIRITRVDCADN